MSLKNKLTLSTVLIILTLGLVATYFIFNYSRQVLVESAEENLRLLTTQQTIVVGEIFEQSRVMVQTMSQQSSIIEYFESNNREFQDDHVLEHLSLYNIGGYFSAIYVMDMDGLTLVSTNESFIGNNYSFRNYFKEASIGNDGFGIQVGVTSGELGYYFSSPIKSSSGDIVGIAVVKLSPALIDSTLLSSTSFLENINVMMVNEDGIIVYTDDPKNLYSSLGGLSEQDLQRIADKKSFPGVVIKPLEYSIVQRDIYNIKTIRIFELFDEMDGEDEIVMIARILNYPVFIFSEISADEFSADAVGISRILGLFVFLAALVSVVVIFFIVGFFMRPLAKLRKFAEVVGTGDKIQKVDIKTGDELEVLGHSLNKMSDRLFKNRQNIEKKIKDRTKQLEKINKSMTGRELKMVELKKQIQNLKNTKK
jgi:C4-dicarboxylate-specific signal transduction histidine kinase